MATIPLIRLRAGMYVTRDAEIRIVRRKFLNKQITRWDCERWSANDREYSRFCTAATLKHAREMVARYLGESEVE